MWHNINLTIIKNGDLSLSIIYKLKVKNLQQPAWVSNAINKCFCKVHAELTSNLPKAVSHFASFFYEGKKMHFPLCLGKWSEGLLTSREHRW